MIARLIQGLTILREHCREHDAVLTNAEGLYTCVGDEAIPKTETKELFDLGWRVNEVGVWHFPT